MRCYCKTLCISYKDDVANEKVCAKIQQAIGTHEDLLKIVKRCKLQWYGHVSHSSGLAKTILQGTVKGGRRQGRQRKRWENNIREWTGLEVKSQRAVENRGKWRKLVAKSSVVSQRPSWLRDRWWWWWWWWLVCWLWASFPKVKILCRLYTPLQSFGWDYKLRSPCIYTQAKRSHMHLKDPVTSFSNYTQLHCHHYHQNLHYSLLLQSGSILHIRT